MNSGQYLKDCKAQIRETDVPTVRKAVESGQGKAGDGNGAGPVLIDVREKDEWTEGFIPGARWISRGFLEQRIEDQVPERSAEIVLYCAGGTRSAYAAKTLAELGYTNVKSLAGGFGAWKRAGLKYDRPFIMTPDQSLRYARHTMLPEVGELGQAKLLQSKVLCLGAGGLGSPTGLYLAAAGVGTVGFVDDDVVDASNLQRQILHATDRVGMPKVESAKAAIAKLNPDVKVIGTRRGSIVDNVLDIIKDYDVIVDGADNFPTRYLINDAALKLGKPLIDGSIYRFEGTVTTFLPFEGPATAASIRSRRPRHGAVLPGGGRAGRAVRRDRRAGGDRGDQGAAGQGQAAVGRELHFDALAMKFREFKRPRDPLCPVCGDGKKPEDIQLIDYLEFCQVRN
jgi:molybdopterin/thiamine biosynthesis adenylyltransferase/rhodanese-related sulfurtransferase